MAGKLLFSVLRLALFGFVFPFFEIGFVLHNSSYIGYW